MAAVTQIGTVASFIAAVPHTRRLQLFAACSTLETTPESVPTQAWLHLGPVCGAAESGFGVVFDWALRFSLGQQMLTVAVGWELYRTNGVCAGAWVGWARANGSDVLFTAAGRARRGQSRT